MRGFCFSQSAADQGGMVKHVCHTLTCKYSPTKLKVYKNHCVYFHNNSI